MKPIIVSVVILSTIGLAFSLTCPTPADISPCTCDQDNSILVCDGASQAQLQVLIAKVKASNPSGSHFSKLKVSNYVDESMDITTFSPCNENDDYCSKPTTAISFTEIDFSNNKKLKYVIDKIGVPKWRNVTVEHVTFRNCSLIKDTTTTHYEYFFKALMSIGPTLKTIDLSANSLVDIPAVSGFDNGFNWPELVTLNVSGNLISDIGYQWFLQVPNVDVVDLSNNIIQNIWNEAFAMDTPYHDKVNKVVTFDLTGNHLSESSTYYSTIFAHLKRPSKLILAKNRFQSLPSSAFNSFLLNPDNTIDMSDNKLFCDCTSNWLKVKAEIYKTQVLNYNCINYQGTNLFDVKDKICNLL